MRFFTPNQIKLNWHIGHHQNEKEPPQELLPAQVPGAVQLDYAKAKNWPPYWYGDNWRDYLWMEDAFWTYRTEFVKPAISAGERLFFCSFGIDYQFSIALNGGVLFRQEGMFTPVNLDLTDFLLPTNTLSITIRPAPKSHNEKHDHRQADASVKPAVSYGWDWHPRLIPLGIWDETFLAVLRPDRMAQVKTNYQLNNDMSQAVLSLQAELPAAPNAEYSWHVLDPGGKIVFEKRGQFNSKSLILAETISPVQLWWPHDHGRPDLYESILTIFSAGADAATYRQKIGFRRVRLVMNDGAWDGPIAPPLTRSVPPIQLEINGRRIFCKGSNWVPPEIFPGIITEERYKELIDLAIAANFNLLRLWGGGIVHKHAFYDYCDEKGIMVWQEFPLACNNYPDTPEYLAVLEQEATSIINRLKPHPCVVLWCGGNELFNHWSRMTDQSLALRLLNSLCFRLDPARPFLPTSPVMGMGHGNYLFYEPRTGEEVFQQMARSRFTAYTEFGVPSPAAADLIRTFIPKDQVWPPKPGTAWQSHHAFQAWDCIPETWLLTTTIERYFGSQTGLEDLAANGQLLQSEGYKCIYESARRQKPYCSMALSWCYNEPWPTAANNSLISWPKSPKPAYYAVQASCRPVLASAKIDKFVWHAGEEFTADLWLLNDGFEPQNGASVLVKIAAENTETLLEWKFAGLLPNTNLAGPTVSFRLPHWATDRFQLVLEVEGHPEWNSSYTLLYRSNPSA